MIAWIKGTLRQKRPDWIVVDVNGVGYRLEIPLSTFYEIPEPGEDVCLHVHTVVREDAIELYGFKTEQEREAFVALIGVSGVGPRVARVVLSGITPQDLADAIRRENGARLHSIPGVGKRMAERILIDLKGKELSFGLPMDKVQPTREGPEEGLEEDVLSALLNLGYKRSEAVDVIERSRRAIEGPVTAQKWLREALRLLVK
jgi:Holliday junction DNA helicase RuvA